MFIHFKGRLYTTRNNVGYLLCRVSPRKVSVSDISYFVYVPDKHLERV